MMDADPLVPPIHVLLVDAALLDLQPVPASLLPPGLVPLVGGWPLRLITTPEDTARALALGRRRGGDPALLWPAPGNPGDLARVLYAAGWQKATLYCSSETDPAMIRQALERVGMVVTLAPEPVLLPDQTRVLAETMGLLQDRAAQTGQPFAADTLREQVLSATRDLPTPWPRTSTALAEALWPKLTGQDLLPRPPGFDPLLNGPAGLTGRRITFVIEKLAERSGGAERVLIETANALAARGHEVEILSHEFRGKPPFYATAPGVRLANLRPRREIRSRLRRLFDRLRAAMERWLPDAPPFDRLVWVSRNGGFHRRLTRHLAATRPDVAVAFLPPAITALALADPRVPLRRIASTHNAPEQDFNNPDRWDPSRLDRQRRLDLMARIDRIAVLLPEYRDWYPAALQDRVTILPNAVTPVDPARLRKNRRARIVLAVGRLAAVKRHDLLIAAWARIAGRFPGWQLHIHGEGPLHHDLQSQIEQAGLRDSVQLRGHTSRITEAYIQAALLAHPAAYEGFPLAVTEALAAGLPVLGFADCSGLNRLVQDGVNGRLIPVETTEIDPVRRIEPLADALAALMADTAARTALGDAGPASMAAYSPESVIALWEDLLFDSPATSKDTPHG